MTQQSKLSIGKLFRYFLDAVTGKEKDFTTGSIRKAVFMLSIPMVLEMSMEAIFAMVDVFFVSKVSVNAVATVGFTESVITLVYAVAIGLSMAATALVARRIGEKDEQGAARAGMQAIILGIIVSAIISFIGIIFARDILSLMGADASVIEEGSGYTQIMLGGNATIMLLFLINAIFRGAGNASIAMWTLIFSNAINIILDPMLIFGFGPIPAYGVEGAAIATNTGRGLAVLAQLMILFFGKSKIQMAWRDIVFRTTIMINLIKVSAGGIGQFLIATSSWVFLMRIMAEFGSDVVAGYTISIRVLLLTLMPAWGMSNAAATLVGQNLGAKQPERAEKSVWKTGKYNAIFLAVVSLAYLISAPHIIAFFNDSQAVIEAGSLSLRVITAGYVFYAYGMVVSQSFNGAGDTKTPTVINFFCFWLFQLPFAYLAAIVLEMGPMGVFLAITLAEVLIAVVCILWFKKGRWKQIQV